MPQATLFDATEHEAIAFDTIGFEIGWDHAHHRLVPPVQHLHAGSPVRQGWQAGRALFGTRTLRVTRHVRKWLQLRLNAWVRGRAFEGLTVTPHFLAQIDVAECPVTREPLAHATGTPSDASVDRVNNDAGYAAGNLAVMSVRANAAKADHAWHDALAVVRELEAHGRAELDGLDARGLVAPGGADELRHAARACAGGMPAAARAAAQPAASAESGAGAADAAHAAVHAPGGRAPGGRARRRRAAGRARRLPGVHAHAAGAPPRRRPRGRRPGPAPRDGRRLAAPAREPPLAAPGAAVERSGVRAPRAVRRPPRARRRRLALAAARGRHGGLGAGVARLCVPRGARGRGPRGLGTAGCAPVADAPHASRHRRPLRACRAA